MNNSELGFIDLWAFYTGYLQLLNYQQNINQSSNDDIMKAVDFQTSGFIDNVNARLNSIEQNQTKILEILEGLKNNGKTL